MEVTSVAAPTRSRRPGWRGVLQTDPRPRVESADGVDIVDFEARREHAPSDLLGAIVSLLGIVVVIVLGVYAHATTVGVTEDVQAITRFLNSLLSVAVSVLGGLVSVVLPVSVLAKQLWRRRIRRSLESVLALTVGLVLAQGVVWILKRFPEQVWQSLTITTHGVTVAALSPYAAGLAAMLVLAGPRSEDSLVRWSWNLLWISLGVEVVTGSFTLPGALVSLWLGTLVGWGLRYLLGSRPERAQGNELVRAIRQTGLRPVSVVRVLPSDVLTEVELAARVAAGRTTGQDRFRLHSSRHPEALAALDEVRAASDSSALAVAAHTGARIYAVTSEDGSRADAVMFDADRRVIGLIERTWQTIRMRGLNTRTVMSLHQAAEHVALVSLIARDSGVSVPSVIGLGEYASSMVIAQEHIPGARSLRELPEDQIDDALIAEIWNEVLRAQSVSLTHGSICADVVLIAAGHGDHNHTEPKRHTSSQGQSENPDVTRGAVPDGDERVWLIGWDDGAVASQELALRIDLAQTLAMIALVVGARRAIATASAALGEDRLAQLAPLLQAVTLPRETRADAKAKRQIMAELRTELVNLLPAVDTTPMPLQRFGWRTVVTATIIVIAAWVLLATMNFDDIVTAIKSANPWWIVATFLFGLLPYLGATLELVAFCPTKLPFWRTTMVQFAASVIALVAPAAVGPAALNLTFLRKRKVETALAASVVALAQVMLFLTTVVLLVVVALLTGDFSALIRFPKTAIMIVVGVAIVVAAALAVPAVRTWVWAKIGPTWRQVWPRMVWVLGQPRRLMIGLAGTTIHAAGYVVSFWAAVQAFGVMGVPFMTIAIIYLFGNTAGSALPTPGGAGTVELALTGGLVSAGVSQAVGASAAVLFRAMTFWLMAPLGYIALRYVRRTGDV